MRHELTIRAGGPTAALDPRELWESRDLFLMLAWRQLAVRYKQTLLGATWAVAQPALTCGVLTAFLGRVASVPSGGRPYFAFSLAGMLPWICFQTASAAAAGSLVENLALVTRVYVPRLVIPLAATAVAFVDLGVALGFLVVLLAAQGLLVPAGLPVLVPAVALLVLAVAGIGVLLAALNTRFRDVRIVVPFLFQSWMLASPVIYPFDLLPPGWKPLAALNPMAGVVEGFRAALLGGPVPWDLMAWSALSGSLLLAVALRAFGAMERYFADTI